MRPSTATLTGRGHEDAGQHLDHGGFAGAVGPEIAHGLAAADSERDVLNRVDFGELGGEQGLDGTRKTGKPLMLPEPLFDVPDRDNRSHDAA